LGILSYKNKKARRSSPGHDITGIERRVFLLIRSKAMTVSLKSFSPTKSALAKSSQVQIDYIKCVEAKTKESMKLACSILKELSFDSFVCLTTYYEDGSIRDSFSVSGVRIRRGDLYVHCHNEKDPIKVLPTMAIRTDRYKNQGLRLRSSSAFLKKAIKN
jgi:hypothetical protein